jgi:PAS domain-containing protein
MNGNGYPYPMRSYSSNGPTMVGNMQNGMQNGMNGFDDAAHGQSLDQIVSQNDKAAAENIRRRSMHVYANGNGNVNGNVNARTQQMGMGSPDNRRLSMMNFGDPSDADDFQFDMQPPGMENMMRNYPRTMGDMQAGRLPTADLAINTQFQNQNSSFANMAAPGSGYPSPMHADVSLDMHMSPYPNGMSMSMDMDDALDMMPNDMNMFPDNQFNTPVMDSPVNQEFTAPPPATGQNNAVSALQQQERFKRPSLSITPKTNSGASGIPSRASSQDQASMRSASRPIVEQHSSSKSNNLPTQMSIESLKNQQPIAQEPGQDLPEDKMNQIEDFKLPFNPPTGGFPSTMHSNPHMKTQFKNAYSSTGFDMLGVLMRVATRPDPQVDIGSVDLSCAFVVCDAEIDDNPIVYCSENFERLTGYTRHMILGRNCRFLQSPDGKVEAGIKRKYVDDDSVLYLKNTISTRTEAQISLINYRRGGQPFMNLLTMIPIAWEPGGPTKFFIGFQVDLVEQPGAMTDKNSGKQVLAHNFPTTAKTA